MATLVPLCHARVALALQVSGSLFFGAGWPGEDWLTSTLQEDAAAPFTDWHTYAVEWELGEIRW